MAEAEGKIFNYDDASKINAAFLETFPFESVYQYIKTETNEFSAVCPFSGLPDLAKVRIEYFPTGGKCVELKSLNTILLVSAMLVSIKKVQQNVSMMI